jgi:hypothetical protein
MFVTAFTTAYRFTPSLSAVSAVLLFAAAIYQQILVYSC